MIRESEVALAATGQVVGDAAGPVVRLAEPLSFWGGVDEDGVVCDVTHPDRGTCLTGSVLVLESGRGSSSSASVLAELIHAGRAPAAIITSRPDGILVLGALVPLLLYGERVPVAVVSPENLERLVTGAHARVVVEAAGTGPADDLQPGRSRVVLSPSR